ncbi:MAG: peroxiredoxin-like family protein [Desulfuromonadaceae bacterium]
MTMQGQLDAVHREISAKVPDLAEKFDADTAEAIRQGLGGEALTKGARIPDFELPDQLGRPIRSVDLLAKGPLVISFYRGSWCPYCNVELHALQQALPEILERGASLVAISPQIPDASLDTAEKNQLSFPVLSDVGNGVARQFGLVFVLSEQLRPLYAQFGIDVPKHDGDDSYELPIPATYIVDRQGTIAAAHVNADYKQRLEPQRILEILSPLAQCR